MKTKNSLILLTVLLSGAALAFFLLSENKMSGIPHKNTGSAEEKVVSRENSNAEGKVKITPAAMGIAGIEVATAGSALMKMSLEFPGEIEFNKNKIANVVPRVAGVVTEVRKNLGDKVKKDEVIAVLDSQGLAESKSQYIQSVHRLEFAQANFIREEDLWKKQISAKQDYLASRHQLEEAELSQQVAEQKLMSIGLPHEDLSLLAIEPEGTVKDREVRTPFPHKELTRYELKSPINGTIVEKQIALGETVKEDANIFVIADLSTVLGGISVYARDLNAVRIGQKVNVKAQALDMEATGTIYYIGPLIGAQTRAAKAYVSIPNTRELWRPGLFVTVEVVREEVKVPVAVTADAIQTLKNHSVVFVQYDTHFEAHPVELGRTDGKWVEIRSGLSPGEKYVSKNSFTLKAELGKSGANR